MWYGPRAWAGMPGWKRRSKHGFRGKCCKCRDLLGGLKGLKRIVVLRCRYRFHQYFITGLVIVNAGHGRHVDHPFLNTRCGTATAKRRVVGLPLLMRLQVFLELRLVALVRHFQGGILRVGGHTKPIATLIHGVPIGHIRFIPFNTQQNEVLNLGWKVGAAFYFRMDVFDLSDGEHD